VGDFFLITFIFSLKRHHFLPYHLDHLFHYHIHPEHAQDQPTTQVNLFLQNHNKKIIIWYIIISKISKHVYSKIIFSQPSTTRYKQASYSAKIYKTIHTNNWITIYLQTHLRTNVSILYAHICKNLSIQTGIILEQKFIKQFV
jgi:hypothetical protein